MNFFSALGLRILEKGIYQNHLEVHQACQLAKFTCTQVLNTRIVGGICFVCCLDSVNTIAIVKRNLSSGAC